MKILLVFSQVAIIIFATVGAKTRDKETRTACAFYLVGSGIIIAIALFASVMP